MVTASQVRLAHGLVRSYSESQARLNCVHTHVQLLNPCYHPCHYIIIISNSTIMSGGLEGPLNPEGGMILC